MTTKNKYAELYKKYPYLVMWCEMMGSMEYYLQSEIDKAERLKVDTDVIFFTDDKPSFFRDCKSAGSIHYFAARGLHKPNITEQEHEGLIDRASENYTR